ncbi:NADPH-dependent FMN reductase [Nocardia sp. CWNU-33]|uniref:NADPH-dependent FMN reductase n=1 Tax=Nocardia sp. CWNU-33 TaxID=3392117 RepID=UPI00398ED2B8
MFVTPEHNRSIPGALKNAIDWASRPWGDNSFTYKPSAVIGTSPGPSWALQLPNRACVPFWATSTLRR